MEIKIMYGSSKIYERHCRICEKMISELIHNKPFKEQSETERITSHTLRYTFAVKCWRGGMDLLVLSKILGHTSLTTTQKYLRVIEEEILEKYEEQASRVL